MFARILYEIRWWRWLFSNNWPMRTLYYGAYRLDRDSRRLIIERCEKEWKGREPMFRGTYPKRRTQLGGE